MAACQVVADDAEALHSPTACEGVFSDDDSGRQLCTYTAAQPAVEPYVGYGGFMNTDADKKQKRYTDTDHGLDYWFCDEYAYGCAVGASCREHGCIDSLPTCNTVRALPGRPSALSVP
jgi:hypothetical protein